MLFRNDIAVNCQGGEPNIEDCAGIEHRGNAIHSHGATPHLDHCALKRNGGPLSITGSVESETGTDLPWDFTENFWGANMTKVLEQKGCNIRLPKIKDKRHGDVNLGIVDVAKFLKEMPADCGPRECPHMKGIY